MEGKILLIRPPDEEVIKSGPVGYETKEMGLLHIGSMLFEHGFDVEVVPGIFSMREILNKIKKLLKKNVISIVGITAVTHEYPEASNILRQIKDINKDITTVVGGPHVTWLDRIALKESPHIDVVVRGEGEETFLELARCDRAEFKKIKGITFQNNSRILRTRDRPLTKDIKNLSLSFFEKYLKRMKGRIRNSNQYDNLICYLMASRGCPYNCRFCAESKFWGNCTRYREIDSLLKEIDAILKFFPKAKINFHDSTFTANRKYIKSFSKKIIEKKFDVGFAVRTRADKYTMEIASILKKASFNGIGFGVEHLHPEVLKFMNRSVSFSCVVQALKNAKSVGQGTVTNWIVGLPGDNLKRSLFSYKCAKIMKMKKLVDLFNICIFVPFPGTEPFNSPSKFGLHILTYDWSKYVINSTRMSKPVKPIIGYDSFSKEDIFFMYNMFKRLEIEASLHK